jgi:tryptophan-rich sensory protein
VGQTIEVLVDPGDPGYAELPGEPAQDPIEGIFGIAFVALFGAVTISSARAYRKHRRLAQDRFT